MGVKEVPQPKLFRGKLKTYQLKGMNWLANLYEQVQRVFWYSAMRSPSNVQNWTLCWYQTLRLHCIDLIPHKWRRPAAKFFAELYAHNLSFLACFFLISYRLLLFFTIFIIMKYEFMSGNRVLVGLWRAVDFTQCSYTQTFLMKMLRYSLLSILVMKYRTCSLTWMACDVFCFRG